MPSIFTSLFSCCDKSTSNTNSKRHTKLEGAGIEDHDNDERRNVRVRNIRRSNLGPNDTVATSLPPRYEDIFDGARQHNEVFLDEKDPRIYDYENSSSTVGADENRDEELRNQRLEVPIAIEIRRSSTTTDTNVYDGDGDRSSIVSIPSTRLSGLTSSYTGATIRTTNGMRNDGENRFSIAGSRAGDFEFGGDSVGSAPPSYYAGSVGGDSAGDEREGEEHPVLSEGWLERLRLHAERSVREGRPT